MQTSRPVVWSIAASDSGGGAGIQADLNTIHSHECHGCTLITAITAQNSVAVEKIHPLRQVDLEAQWQALEKDLLPNAIKIGLIPEPSTLRWLAKHLAELKKRQAFFCVWDPVLKASTGARFLDAFDRGEINPLLKTIDLITPNLSETSLLTQIEIRSFQDIERAAEQLLQRGAKAVLIKGGHSFLEDKDHQLCQDYFLSAEQSFWLQNPKQIQPNSHGTGCTLASAIAANIALGNPLATALIYANAFIQQSLRLAAPQGTGAGPVWQTQPQNSGQDFPVLCQQPDANQLQFLSAPNLGLYAIVDSLQWAKDCIASGIDTLQWRVKNPNKEQLLELPELIQYCHQQKVPLYINDHWQLAIEHNAYGVHLGQEDLDDSLLLDEGLPRIAAKGMRLGLSCHNESEIARARYFNPSYLAFGPVFLAKSKQVDHPCLGTHQLQAWYQRYKHLHPMTCIGGIATDNLTEVLSTGIESVAVISAVQDKAARQRFTQQFRTDINAQSDHS